MRFGTHKIHNKIHKINKGRSLNASAAVNTIYFEEFYDLQVIKSNLDR